MKRRAFLHAGAAASLLGTLPRFALASGFDPRPGAWRYFDVTTRVDVLKPAGASARLDSAAVAEHATSSG